MEIKLEKMYFELLKLKKIKCLDTFFVPKFGGKPQMELLTRTRQSWLRAYQSPYLTIGWAVCSSINTSQFRPSRCGTLHQNERLIDSPNNHSSTWTSSNQQTAPNWDYRNQNSLFMMVIHTVISNYNYSSRIWFRTQQFSIINL